METDKIMETEYKKNRKPLKALRIVNACFLGILIFIALVAVVFIVADKFVLNGSLSFFIINALIDHTLGQVILQIGTTLFLPFFLKLETWAIVLIILIPAALILINIFVVKRIRRNDIARIVCRLFIYFCLMIYVTAVSLSMVYTDYAIHVATKFTWSVENFDPDSFYDIQFESVQRTVKSSKLIAQKIIDTIIMELNMELKYNPNAMDNLDEIYYLEVAEAVALCFQVKDTVNSREEHYLRNAFCRAPKTLDDMKKEIKDKSPFDWVLLSQAESVYHMQGENGAYNVKFVSADGYHEAVYNKEGVLLTEANDPVNMGTFNYAGPLTDPAMHAALDILPYYTYGNCPASPVSSKENYDYQNNPDAQKYWSDLKALLGSL